MIPMFPVVCMSTVLCRSETILISETFDKVPINFSWLDIAIEIYLLMDFIGQRWTRLLKTQDIHSTAPSITKHIYINTGLREIFRL